MPIIVITCGRLIIMRAQSLWLALLWQVLGGAGFPYVERPRGQGLSFPLLTSYGSGAMPSKPSARACLKIIAPSPE